MENLKEIISKTSNQWIFSHYANNDYNTRNVAEYDEGNVVLIGMRRLGKTEYLKYRKDLILSDKIDEDYGVEPTNKEEQEQQTKDILFIDFDSPVFATINFSQKESKSFGAFNEAFIELIKENKYKLVLIDEIQERDEWSKWLKGLADLFEKTNFAATGSDAQAIALSNESGLGRFKTINIGPLTYREFLSAQYDVDETLENYLDKWVFPSKQMNSDIEMQFQQVYEKQLNKTNSRNSNIMSILKYIYLNPGIELNTEKAIRTINEVFLSKMSTDQFNNILMFLINSKIVLKIPNLYTQRRVGKRNRYKLYPSNWNLYKIEGRFSGYDELGLDSLPRAGFIFENMIISSIISGLNTPMQQSRIGYYKYKHEDYDLSIGDKNYEIKSFDFINHNDSEQWKKLTLKKDKLESVIHMGPTIVEKGIKFINAEKFMEEEQWKIKIL